MVDSRTRKGKIVCNSLKDLIMSKNTHRGMSKGPSSQLEGVSNGQMIKEMNDHP